MAIEITWPEVNSMRWDIPLKENVQKIADVVETAETDASAAIATANTANANASTALDTINNGRLSETELNDTIADVARIPQLNAFPGWASCADRGQHGQEYRSNGTDVTAMTRSRYSLTRDVKQLRLGFVGWWWDQVSGVNLEKLNDGPLTIRVALEINGIIIPLFFGGQRDGILEPGAVLLTDPVSAEAAAASTFFVRTYVTSDGDRWNTNTIVSHIARPGEGYETGASVTDKTLSGTVTTAETRGFGPSLILAEARAGLPLVAAIGDSILYGQNDVTTTLGSTTDRGFIARAMLTGQVPYTKIGSGGDKTSGFKTWANSYNRRLLVPGATHAVVYIGINGLRQGDTAASVIADLTIIYQWLADLGIEVWACTIGPRSTSTDSWATTVNQTPDTYNANRVTVNEWIRTTPAPLTGYFDVADTIESARNSGIWKVNGSAFYYTTDGLHPSTRGHELMAPAIDTTVFV